MARSVGESRAEQADWVAVGALQSDHKLAVPQVARFPTVEPLFRSPGVPILGGGGGLWRSVKADGRSFAASGPAEARSAAALLPALLLCSALL